MSFMKLLCDMFQDFSLAGVRALHTGWAAGVHRTVLRVPAPHHNQAALVQSALNAGDA